MGCLPLNKENSMEGGRSGGSPQSGCMFFHCGCFCQKDWGGSCVIVSPVSVESHLKNGAHFSHCDANPWTDFFFKKKDKIIPLIYM